MKELKTTKSILAKLLASENITVSHQTTKTAYFDLDSRTLVCPTWKDMDGNLYDLLMGHEVGHALETPAQGWHDAIVDKDGGKVNMKFKSFLNVIEDARIEKKIKRKFPGLAKSFSAAYKDLYDRDFFGVKNVDINKLNLIDRINLKFKLGAHMHVPFNDYERGIIQQVEVAETWEQVEAIARSVYAYVKEKEQEKIQGQSDLNAEKFEEEKKENESLDALGLQEDQDQDDQDQDDFDGDLDSLDDLEEEFDSEEGEEPESVTDMNFRQRESELVNESGKVGMFYLPEPNLEKIILPNSIVMNDLDKFLARETLQGDYGKYNILYNTVIEKCVRKFNLNNKKFISHILREFDMRKKATSYARSQTAKTGELDMQSLYNYKFTNDIFKKIQIVPKGKNHGMILFLDMSGSMGSIFRNTIEQLLVLVSFCKKANIPFDVYGFSDAGYEGRTVYLNSLKSNEPTWQFNKNVDVRLDESSFHLKHMIGSSLPPAQYRKSFNLLAVVANEFDRSSYETNKDHGSFSGWNDAGFRLNSTPFVETLLASREIISKFSKANQLDITNVIYLTDGVGDAPLLYPPDFDKYQRNSVVYLIDKKTKKKIRLNAHYDQQQTLTQLVRDVSGCKHIGYYLTSNIFYQIKSLRDHNDYEKMKRSAKENGFFSCSTLGYDQYFYMLSSDKSITEQKMNITQEMTKHKMAQALSKAQTSKRSNRLLVSKFAEEIATAA